MGCGRAPREGPQGPWGWSSRQPSRPHARDLAQPLDGTLESLRPAAGVATGPHAPEVEESAYVGSPGGVVAGRGEVRDGEVPGGGRRLRRSASSSGPPPPRARCPRSGAGCRPPAAGGWGPQGRRASCPCSWEGDTGCPGSGSPSSKRPWPTALRPPRSRWRSGAGSRWIGQAPTRGKSWPGPPTEAPPQRSGRSARQVRRSARQEGDEHHER